MNNNEMYLDEQIIKMINEKEKELEKASTQKRIEQEIKTGKVWLNGRTIEFEEKSLLDDRVKICIPKDFQLMSPEIAAMKYPYEKRPKIIYTDETTTVNISLNHIESELLEKDMAEFTDSMKSVIEKLHPSGLILEDGVMEIEGKKLGYFEFVNEVLDASIYSIMFFAELEGKALIGSVNCIEDDMGHWGLLARGIMASLRTC